MAVDRETRKAAYEKIRELKRNPPRETPESRAKAAEMQKEFDAFEAKKDRDIASERQSFSKDIAGFVHNQLNGVGVMFNGFGPGVKKFCEFPGCGEHSGTMYNTPDDQWYCPDHKWFGYLTKEQKEKELSCLKTKQK